MALTPVPYAQNWKDVFGSQYAPEAQATKTAPIVIAAPATLVGQVATINRTHALAMTVDWGDGIVEAAASGAKTHTYARRGDFRIRSKLDAWPDIYVDELIRVTTRPAATAVVANHPTVTNAVLFTISGALYPLSIQWGDGDSRFEESEKGTMNHTYPAPGSYTIRVSNGEGAAQLFPITVPTALEDPEPAPEAHWDPPYPWANFATNALLNDFVEEHDLEVPSAWFQWTIAAKKQHLADHFGNG